MIVEGGGVPVEGWDFSWLAGRATEERPPWGYARLVAARMAAVSAALDVDTGGGEVLAEVPAQPSGSVPPLPSIGPCWSGSDSRPGRLSIG